MASVGASDQDQPVQWPEVINYLTFLSDATKEITSSLDYEKTLQNVANAMVPHLSDWCAVDILENGQLKRVAVAHSTPDKLPLAHRLTDEYPPRPDVPSGYYMSVRTGEPQIFNGMNDETYRAMAVDAKHLDILRKLDMYAYMIYPVSIFHGEVLGAITFVWAEHKRKYNMADLAFAEVLSAIAAGAIKNALVHKR